MNGRWAWSWVWLVGLALPMLAQETYPRFDVGAFGTLGLAATDTHKLEFRRDVSQPHGAIDHPTSTIDTSFGVHATAYLTPTLKGLFQVASKYRYDGSRRPDIYQACLYWDPAPGIQVRAGRIGLEQLPHSDFASVGYTFLWVRPPVEAFSQVNNHYIEGLQVSGFFDLDPGTRVSLQVAGGYSNEKMPIPGVEPLDFTGGRYLVAQAKVERSGFSSRIAYLQSRNKHNLGAPITDFQALLRGISLAAHDPKPALFADSLNLEGSSARGLGIDFWLMEGPFQVQGSVVRGWTDHRLFTNTWTGFLSLGYRLGDWVPYAYWSGAISDRRPDPDLGILPLLPQGAFVQGLANTLVHSADRHQSTYSAGVRWDFATNMDLKAQVDFVRAHNSTSGWIVREPGWNGKATVFSVCVDFVFGGRR